MLVWICSSKVERMLLQELLPPLSDRGIKTEQPGLEPQHIRRDRAIKQISLRHRP